MIRLRNLFLGCACALAISGPAGATPTLDFDVDLAGSSLSLVLTSVSCSLLCDESTAPADGLDNQIFSLAEGQSYTFDFFKVSVQGTGANITFDATATLAFTLPAGASATGTGAGGFTADLVLPTSGSLTWDASVPVEVQLPSGATFVVDFSDIDTFVGTSNEDPAIVQATVTVTHIPEPPTAVPEPATIGLFGLGLVGIGSMRRRRRA